MEDKIALFDLDNTLADYAGQLTEDLALMQSPEEKPYVVDDHQGKTPPYIEHRIRAIKNFPGWWTKLPTLSDGFEILSQAIAIGFVPQILTKGPVTTKAAWSEKLTWVENFVDPFVAIRIGPEKLDAIRHRWGTTSYHTPVTITYDKSSVYGRVLVDDYPPYVEGWLKNRPRGLVIMPARKCNENFKHPQVVRFDSISIDSFQEMVGRLREAYNRK